MDRDIILFGGLLLDRYFSVDSWPKRGQDGYFSTEESFVGGCAVNMAATIQNLGGTCHVVSSVGSDQTGEEIRAYCKAHGFSSRFLVDIQGVTGSCLVFSEPDGERTFLTRKGMEETFPLQLAERLRGAPPGWVGVTGYYLLSEDGEAIMASLEELSARGAKLLFDPSPLVGDIPPQLRKRVLEISQVLTPNESELEALGGLGIVEGLVQGGKTLILKQGAQGGVVYAPEETFAYSSVPCAPVDTTGAGDSFSGALLYAFARGMTLREGVALAARCAAKTVQIHGPHGFWKEEETNV